MLKVRGKTQIIDRQPVSNSAEPWNQQNLDNIRSQALPGSRSGQKASETTNQSVSCRDCCYWCPPSLHRCGTWSSRWITIILRPMQTNHFHWFRVTLGMLFSYILNVAWLIVMQLIALSSAFRAVWPENIWTLNLDSLTFGGGRRRTQNINLQVFQVQQRVITPPGDNKPVSPPSRGRGWGELRGQTLIRIIFALWAGAVKVFLALLYSSHRV